MMGNTANETSGALQLGVFPVRLYPAPLVGVKDVSYHVHGNPRPMVIRSNDSISSKPECDRMLRNVHKQVSSSVDIAHVFALWSK